MRSEDKGETMKNDMYLACCSDSDIAAKAENGGAVTSLLKFALEKKWVDAVVAVKARGGNRYDGIPVLITEPEEVMECAGSLHCASPNIAQFLKEYLDGVVNQKIAVTCKPCDARAIIELAKRNQIYFDNLILIGLNCTGTLPPAKAKRMIEEEFGINPFDVAGEDIEENKLILRLKDGSEKERDLKELEEKGYGRRDNCRRCDINIPTMADLACGKWGAKPNTTFIEVCSDRGSDFIDEAIKAGYIKVERPDDKAVTARRATDQAAVESAQQCQEKDFADFKQMSVEERFNYWFGMFGKCIKCFGCRDACPICYCKDCTLEADRGMVGGGDVPPDVMFPMIRISHVMDSCVNCGQCQDVCPMELPLSRLIFMLNKELCGIFKHEPGMDVSALPPMRTTTDKELTIESAGLVL
jgi:formate dehydrogenase subunit beta